MRAVAAGGALVLFLAGGCSRLVGGVPVGVGITADSDTTVLVAWQAPAEGTPGSYLVYFREVGSPSFTTVAETAATSWSHLTRGLTGTYKVAASFSGRLYESPERVTTVPVHTDSMRLAELDATGNSGCGWDPVTGTGASYAMEDGENAPRVDFYVTDFDTGHAGPVYHLASPHYGPTDPSGVVPTASWRRSGFVEVTPYEQGPLPAYADTVYLDYRELTTAPATFGCLTEEGHFALVKAVEVDSFDGEVEVESWFQLVPGLRLVRH